MSAGGQQEGVEPAIPEDAHKALLVRTAQQGSREPGIPSYTQQAAMKSHTCVAAAPCLGDYHAVTGSADGSLQLWDLSTPECVCSIQV